MNRYRSGGPSKASATTLCQKCLKKGHYSYECSAAQQERPYQSRPSRTQQLANPKLAPKLSAVLPPADVLPTKSATSLANRPEADLGSRGRSAGRQSSSDRKRRRSISTHSSSDSVSTISTNRSPSRSPPPRKARSGEHHRSSEREHGRSTRRSPPSVSPDRRHVRSPSGIQAARSPSRSVSPDRVSRRPDRSEPRRSRSPRRDSIEKHSSRPAVNPARQRSLSPYSQRIALTRSLA